MSRSARIFASACTACLLVAPLAAEGVDESPDREEFDFEKFADAAREAFDKLSEEFLPLLEELGEKIGDMSEYHAPEVLPNGDIIIRRKTPDETLPEDEGETLDL